MASPGNQHCANCIGTLSILIGEAILSNITRKLLWSEITKMLIKKKIIV